MILRSSPFLHLIRQLIPGISLFPRSPSFGICYLQIILSTLKRLSETFELKFNFSVCVPYFSKRNLIYVKSYLNFFCFFLIKESYERMDIPIFSLDVIVFPVI